jgi:predicted RNA-binding Zn-ribbon protein involved in translation (DUF1610 family)
VNDRLVQILKLNSSGLGCWASAILVTLLLTSLGLGWVLNGFIILIALLFIVPVVGVWGLQWWLKRKLIHDRCPVCSYEFTGFKNTQFNCPSCGETLQIEGDNFSRMTPPGTIDVDAVEISAQSIEEEN